MMIITLGEKKCRRRSSIGGYSMMNVPPKQPTSAATFVFLLCIFNAFLKG